jgi:hypothetical protein
MKKNQKFSTKNWQNSFFTHTSGHKAGISFGADWDDEQEKVVDCFYFNLYDQEFNTIKQIFFHQLDEAIEQVNQIYANESAWIFEDMAVSAKKAAKSGGCATCSAH